METVDLSSLDWIVLQTGLRGFQNPAKKGSVGKFLPQKLK